MSQQSGRKFKPPQENPIDPVGNWKTYKGFQKLINSNKGEIDEDLLNEHIEELMSSETTKWEEIPVDFSLLKTGERIRYTTLTPEGKHLFRTGGWITHIPEDYKYLAYMAHTKSTWCLQVEDCQRIFVVRKTIKNKVEVDRTIYFKIPGIKTAYNSYLDDSEGNKVIVGSFKSRYDLDKFESRHKYIKASNGEPWDFK